MGVATGRRDRLETDHSSWGLAMDLYQLTMAQGYRRSGIDDRQAIFHMFFRQPPFGGRYVVAAGADTFGTWLEHERFSSRDIEFLATLNGSGGRPLFEDDFLNYLSTWRFRGVIDVVPEGMIVFPYEPLIRVRAPLIDAQLIETTMLSIVNFQSLIATKASRIRFAAGTDEVLEFGLRRAHGLDGGLSASLAAFIGGVDATSNVLASQCYNIPVRGTHAHSWVLAFADEPTAFHAYCQAFPHNSVLLVDTYDTLEGVRNAIDCGRYLRSQGAELMGIRLDSGDLAYLSTEARRLLDAAGFQQTKIVASNDLDERLIASLKAQSAPIDIWGVGTKLVTAFDEPALGGVYKLTAIENRDGKMEERIKISEQAGKTTIPGCLEILRFKKGGRCVGDVMYDTLTEEEPVSSGDLVTIISPLNPWKRKVISLAEVTKERLLVPFFANGKRIAEPQQASALRQRTLDNLSSFDRAIFRFDNPHAYAAGLSQQLFERREAMRAAEFEKIRSRHARPDDGTGRGNSYNVQTEQQ
jgi:nicotinate phosphoribosyltransferase